MCSSLTIAVVFLAPRLWLIAVFRDAKKGKPDDGHFIYQVEREPSNMTKYDSYFHPNANALDPW
jgi:hypothetical protein